LAGQKETCQPVKDIFNLNRSHHRKYQLDTVNGEMLCKKRGQGVKESRGQEFRKPETRNQKPEMKRSITIINIKR